MWFSALVLQMPRTFNCHQCNLAFSRKTNWERHFRNVHELRETTYQCPFCNKQRKHLCDMRGHLRKDHPEKKELVRADPSLIREVGVRSPVLHTSVINNNQGIPPREFNLDDSLWLSPAVKANLDRYVGKEEDFLQLAARISSITPVTPLDSQILVTDGIVASPITFQNQVLPATGSSTQGVTTDKPEATNVQQELSRSGLPYQELSLVTSPSLAKETPNQNVRPPASGELKSVSGDDDPVSL